MKAVNIDQNVHPTKKEVRFLFEQEICKEVERQVLNLLKDSSIIKALLLRQQQLLPQENQNDTQKKRPSEFGQIAPKKQIRIDPKDQRITQFFGKVNVKDGDAAEEDNQKVISEDIKREEEGEQGELQNDVEDKQVVNETVIVAEAERANTGETEKPNVEEAEKSNTAEAEEPNVAEAQKSNEVADRVQTLASQRADVKRIQTKLLNEIQVKVDDATNKFFKNLSYVGSTSSNHFVAQSDDELYLINAIPFVNEVLRLEMARKLGYVTVLELEEPVDVADALEWFLKHCREIPAERCQHHLKNVEMYVNKLNATSDILTKYVGIRIQEGKLVQLPNPFGILSQPCTFVTKQRIRLLAYCLLRIITRLDFESETEELVRGIIEEVSSFFAWNLESNVGGGTITKKAEDQFSEIEKKKWDEIYGLMILPLIKVKPHLPQLTVSDFTVKLFKQQDVYKIFERC